MTWTLVDQRVVSGIDPVNQATSYAGLKTYMQWLVGTYLVSRGYETYIDDSDDYEWYYGVRKNWQNKFAVDITTSYVNKFRTNGSAIVLSTWDLGSNDPTVGIDQQILNNTNNSLLNWISGRRGPQTMQVWESDQDSSSWLWRRVEPPNGSYSANFFGMHWPDNCFTQLKDYGDDVWKYYVDELGLDKSVFVRLVGSNTSLSIPALQYAGTTKGVLSDRWTSGTSDIHLEPANVNGDIFYYSQSPVASTFSGRQNNDYSGNYKIGANYYISLTDPSDGTLMFDTGSIDPSDPLA